MHDAAAMPHAEAPASSAHDRRRTLTIGLIAFLTVVDLFAAQAVLPALVRVYDVTPAAMGFAVNASTMGMAAAGFAVACFGRTLDQRAGIVASLLLLSIPTALLSVAPNLAVFTLLRVAQGLFMATAFTLTLAYLGEHCSARAAAGAFAAYITGNVASNLVGRLVAATVADTFGVEASFLALAALNLAGAALVATALTGPSMAMPAAPGSPLRAVAAHLRNPALRSAFAIGFCILFAFIGTFTYVNFVLVRAPLGLDQMALGLVYVVFAPSILTTPAAGRAVARFGAGATFRGALLTAAAGLPLLVLPSLPAVLAGLVLVAVGTFFAQAVATGFVGQAATTDRTSASGLYLASYFFGGLVGSFVLGQIFDRRGWTACVVAIGLSLAAAALLSLRLHVMPVRSTTAAPQ